MAIDLFQERYLAHQERKKKLLDGEIEYSDNKNELDSLGFAEIVNNRVSQRIFNGNAITEDELEYIKQVIVNTPSSCNRQAVQIMMIGDDRKKYIEKLLVGGVNWIGKADIIMLLMADMDAYKSPAERDFMSYLDSGFIGMSVYYATTVLGLGCCFVNPNIREENKGEFNNLFNKKGYRFCGAIAIGNYNKKGFKIKKDNNIFI